MVSPSCHSREDSLSSVVHVRSAVISALIAQNLRWRRFASRIHEYRCIAHVVEQCQGSKVISPSLEPPWRNIHYISVSGMYKRYVLVSAWPALRYPSTAWKVVETRIWSKNTFIRVGCWLRYKPIAAVM